jgi:hypothetical protein
MLARVLIVFLAIAGPNPLRICTCAEHDEPLLAAVGGDDHSDDCDCPVFQPVAKQTAPPVAAPDSSAFTDFLPIDASTHSRPIALASHHFQRSAHPPAVPLHVTLRTWRN